jgi:protoporphyrinogen oxidase
VTALPDSFEHPATRVGVIGGGITGLTAAYRLAKQGHQVILWEQADKLGGLAAAFPVHGGELEYFYHHLFLSDRAIVELIEELGIGDALVWLNSKNDYFADGQIFSLSGATDLLRLPVVPIWDRFRVGLVTLYLQRISTASGRWHRFEQVTAWNWLRRAVGKRAFQRMFGRQLKAKFGPRASEIAMVWFWNKIYLRTQSRKGLFAKEELGYILGSFNVLIDRLAEACREQGVEVRAGIGVQAIEVRDDQDDRFLIRESSGGSEPVDYLLATVPSQILLRLFPDIAEPYRAKLQSTVYQGAVCVLLELDHPLSDAYWLNIVDDRLPFTCVVEHTNFVGPEHYDGARYVYVNKYVDWDHPYVTMSDDDVFEEYLSYLPLINPLFDRSWVRRHWVFKARDAQPIIGVDYSRKIPEHRTPIQGLYLANMAQIYPEDRGTNYAVDLGNRISALIDGDIGMRRPD